jgi:hypothetical protein
MGKKKFIAKNEGQHFHVLHRSLRDEAYSNYAKPSDFVLVPSAKVFVNSLIYYFTLNILKS